MKLFCLSILTSMAFGCQEASEVATKANADASPAPSAVASTNESDASEGVVGPDEAYFAGVYLGSVFKASQANPHLALADSSLSLKPSGQVEAFDFAANLQPKRLEFMGRILMKLGDKDGDQKLSFDEFSAIKLSPELQGSSGPSMSLAFDKDLFDAVAGDDGLISDVEIQDFLARIASACDLSKMSKAEIKQMLTSGWEKVIAGYDADKDGKASLEEQRALRKDRALLMSRFTE